MAKDGLTFDRWLGEARIPEKRQSPELIAVLQAAFWLLEEQGWDFASRRLVEHFLGHGHLGLKMAEIARLVGCSRPTASRHQSLSSRAVVREIQHHLSGRPYGKLLPRYAGPIVEFLVTHPEASREDVLDFIERTWEVRVSTVALHKFLKKYGLDRASREEARAAQAAVADPLTDEAQLHIAVQEPAAPGLPLAVPRQEFFLLPPNTPVPFCCCPKSSPGGERPKSVSLTTTASYGPGS